MDKKSKYNIVAIIGATAGGKTSVATQLAYELDGEILSADSRQIYRGMDIGTGKDLVDYNVNGKAIPYHLIDIADAGEKYSVYLYQKDFFAAYQNIVDRGKFPILCGGSGLYIESVLKSYKMLDVPKNNELRSNLEKKSLAELAEILASYKKLHNKTDTDTRERAIRGIEIEDYYQKNPQERTNFPKLNPLIIGVKFDRLSRRKRITQRLMQRLDEGMIDEVKTLLKKGVPAETLLYYGLEYKYITLYLTGQISYDEMVPGLETAIHQFSKRQMTWFRRMERQGTKIHWLDGYQSMEEKMNKIKNLLS